jgi:chemotaxis protein MotB
MARKKPHPEHENHERWMVSYADFITLMFAFFVVMFATSQTDKAHAQQVSDSVKQALDKGGVAAAVHEILGGTVDDKGKGNAQMKGPGGSEKAKVAPERAILAELLPSLQYLNKELQAEIHDGKIEMHLEPRGLVLSLRQATFFPSGGDTIDPKTYPIVEKIAQTMRELPNSVRLEGHTDSVPIHTARFHSNWELSAARSIGMMELLSDRFEIPRQRMAIAGYADTAPLDSNDTQEGRAHNRRAHNRRVDVVILNQQVKSTEGGSVPSDTPTPPKPADRKSPKPDTK